MYVKITNCKVWTGGGKRKSAVPLRIRHNQNVRLSIPDAWDKLTDYEIKIRFEYMVDHTIITTPNSKVIRNPISNSKIKLKRYERFCSNERT